ncbi:hypothetical protein E2562_013624, partial [Oryza meyeriana var. granulata]
IIKKFEDMDVFSDSFASALLHSSSSKQATNFPCSHKASVEEDELSALQTEPSRP